MKKMIGIFFIMVNCFAGDIDIAHNYQKALDAYQIDNNKVQAKAMLEEILEVTDRTDSLYNDIYNTYLELIDVKEREGLTKAIKFVTGRKEEIFCKNIGLVYAHYFHNDGTESQLILTESKRKLEKGSYSVITEGSWKYQLDTEYRKPIESDLWINDGDSTSYDIREARKNGDKGSWKQYFKPGSNYGSNSTSGDVKEPLPMYMAFDFQVWGTPDAGYGIDFKVGATDKTTAGENTFVNGRLFLASERVVKKKIQNFQKKDFNNQLHKYNDCFQVNTKIQLASIRPKGNSKKK